MVRKHSLRIYEQRIRAVQLLIKYDMSYSTVIHELGYPDSGSLRGWYKEYKENGDLHKDHTRKSMYTFEQKRAAVDYYLEHGKCVMIKIDRDIDLKTKQK